MAVEALALFGIYDDLDRKVAGDWLIAKTRIDSFSKNERSVDSKLFSR